MGYRTEHFVNSCLPPENTSSIYARRGNLLEKRDLLSECRGDPGNEPRIFRGKRIFLRRAEFRENKRPAKEWRNKGQKVENKSFHRKRIT